MRISVKPHLRARSDIKLVIRNKREIGSLQNKYPIYYDTSVAGSYGCAGRVIRTVHDNSQLGVSPPYHSPRQPLAAAYLISKLSELPKIVTIFFYYPQVVQFLKSSVDRKML